MTNRRPTTNHLHPHTMVCIEIPLWASAGPTPDPRFKQRLISTKALPNLSFCRERMCDQILRMAMITLAFSHSLIHTLLGGGRTHQLCQLLVLDDKSVQVCPDLLKLCSQRRILSPEPHKA